MKNNKQNKKFNTDYLKFVAKNAFLVILLVLGICLQFVFNSFQIKNFSTFISIFSSVATAILAILTLSLELSDKKVYGSVELNELLKLRSKPYFKVWQMIIIVLMEVILSVITFIAKLEIIAIFICMICLLHLIWFIIQDFPLLCGSFKAYNKLIRLSYKKYLQTGIESQEANQVINVLIFQKGILETYKILAFKSNDKTLMISLFDRQRKSLLKEIRTESEDEIGEKITMALHNCKIIFEDVCKSFWDENDAYLFTQTVYACRQIANHNKKYVKLVNDEISSFMESLIFFLGRKEKPKELYSVILCNIVISSLGSKSLDEIDLLNDLFNRLPYYVNASTEIASIIELISAYLYNLVKVNREYPYKKELQQWIDKQETIIDRFRLKNWKTLIESIYNRRDSKCELSFMLKLTKACAWDYCVFNEGSWLTFTETFIAKWFLIYRLNSFMDFPFRKIFDSLGEDEQAIVLNVLENYYKEGKFEFTGQELLSFYGISDYLSLVSKNEKVTKELIDCINNDRIHKKDKENEETKNQNLDDIKNQIESDLKKEILSYYGYKDSIDLPNNRMVFYNTIRKAPMQEFYTYIAENYAHEIVCSLPLTQEIDTLNFSHCSAQEIEDILIKKNIKYQTNSILNYVLLNYEKDDRKKLTEIIAKISNVEKSVFDLGNVVFDTNVGFNFSIDLCEVKQLSAEQAEKLADSYKRDDGLFFFEGIVIADREKVLKYIYDEYFTIRIEFRVAHSTKNIYKVEW